MRRTMRWMGVAMCCAFSAGIAACGGGPEVFRVVNGRVVGGNFVEPEAYAAFLRGAIAEAEGNTAAALGAYEDAARYDADDPEVWTRIGDVRCKSEHGKTDSSADAALDRALRIDASYAPAWDARARCALSRGDAAKATDAAAHSIAADPLAVEAEVLRARVGQGPSSAAQIEETRRRLIALTMFHAERVEAWEALFAFASTHADGALRAIALQHLAVLAPSKRAQIDAAARAFDGAGDALHARALAAALVDAGWTGDRKAGTYGRIARLAIDEALLAGDAERARLRATHAHLDLDVVAARALLLGDATLARALAEPLALADPAAVGASIVLAASAPEGDDAARARALRSIDRAAPQLSNEALLVLTRLLARTTTIDAARAFASRVSHAPLLAHDALTTSLAVDLAARGILDTALLPPDGVVELAARRGEAPPGDLLRPNAVLASPNGDTTIATTESALDARHALLALALLDPRAARTQTLARELAPSIDRDAIVAVAFVRLALAGAAPVRADALARFDPSDALVAAAAYDLAVRGGNAGVIPSARARLAAVAHTPAERRRVE